MQEVHQRGTIQEFDQVDLSLDNSDDDEPANAQQDEWSRTSTEWQLNVS